MNNFCLEKWKFSVKLPTKIEISRKFEWENPNFFDPDPRTSDFKSD